MTNSHKFFRWINRTLPLAISVTSLTFAGIALRYQTDQSRMQLWHDYRREFDFDLKPERKAFGKAFVEQHNVKGQYDEMMTFFENLGFLLRTRHINDDLFDQTFSYDFIAYFKASKQWMDQAREKEGTSPTVWQNVYYLADRYKDHPLLNNSEGLNEYFAEESNLPEK